MPDDIQTPNDPPVRVQPVAGRRVVQIAMSSTDHVVNDAANYLLAALCDDGSIFIASATTQWLQVSPIPQPPNDGTQRPGTQSAEPATRTPMPGSL